MVPKLSIIVPIYNVEDFIVKCSVSLFNQDYPNIEFIFVNDLSPDNSLERLEKVISKYNHLDVLVIQHENNKGLSAARNTGIANATGEYVMHVDSDDYLDSPTVVSNVMKCLLDSAAEMALFDMKYIYPSSTSIRRQEVCNDKHLYVSQVIERKVPVCVCGGVYKRSLYIDNNIWAVDGLNFGEDYAVKPRLAYCASKIIHVPNVYYCYRQDNNNSYTKKYNPQILKDIDKSICILKDFFVTKPEWGIKWKKSLDIAAIKIFADKLVYWSASNSPICDFDAIRRQTVIQGDCKNISLKHQIALWCAKNNTPLLLRNIIKGGLILKKLIRYFKVV